MIKSSTRNALWKNVILALVICLAGNIKTTAQTYATSQVNYVYGTCVLCGIVNPNNPVNNGNLTDYSSYAITVGLIGVSVEQALVFPAATTNAGKDELIIRIGADNATLYAALFYGLSVETYNGTTPNNDVTAASSKLRILNGGTAAEIVLRPSATFDRVKLNLISVNVGALQGLRIYYAYYQPAKLPNANGILFVKKGSSGTGDSWSNPVGEVADALKAAKTNPDIKQIWVAGGMYKPLYTGNDNGDESNARTKTFVLVDGVRMYGGFAGNESSLNERDLSNDAHQTILSGDIDNNDAANGTIFGNNSYHVVMAANALGNTGNYHLDGFVIQGGKADNPGNDMSVNAWVTSGSNGAAIAAYRGRLNINACKIRGNFAQTRIIYFLTNDTYMANTLVTGNRATGGYIIEAQSGGRLEIVNNTFAGNKSDAGYLGLSVTTLNMVNSIIYGNANNQIIGALTFENGIWQGFAGGTNIDADPMFNAPLSAENAPFTGGDYTLKAGSPAINAGSNAAIKSWTNGVGPTMMADVIAGSSCFGTGGGCNLTGRDNLTTSDLTDFALISLSSTGSQAYSTISMQWLNQTIKAGDVIGFIIETENIPIGNTTLLGNIVLRMSGATGPDFYSLTGPALQTTTLNGQTINYVGFTAPRDGVYTSITLTQIPNVTTRLRVKGVFKWQSDARSNNSTDLNGKPRISNQAGGGMVDIGAYETQTSPQTITASDITKTYGEAAFAPAVTASSGLAVTYSSGNTAIAEPFFDAADGKYKLKIKSAGTVTITANQSGNGSWEAAPAKTFQLTVQQKTVTVNVKSTAVITRAYNGQAQTTFNSDNLEFASGDIVSGDDVKAKFNGIAVYDDEHVGTNKTLTLNVLNFELEGTAAANYTIGNTTDIIFNNASITKAIVTVTPGSGLKKVYGETDPVFNFTNSYMVNGETITGALGRVAGEDAGDYNFTTGTLSAGNNYSINLAAAVFTINKKPVTASIKPTADISKVYDGNADYTMFMQDLEFAAGDIINNDQVTFNWNFNVLSFDNKNAGTNKTVTYPLNSFYLAGAKAGNYVISNTTDLTANIGTITPASLTVTANAAGKTYGQSDPSLSFTAGQLANGDAITGAPTRQTGEDAGEYDITKGTLTAGNNYTINFTGAKFTIGKKAVLVNFKSSAVFSKVYDGTDKTTITGTDLGFVAGAIINADAVSISLAADAAIYDNRNVGTSKTIAVPYSAMTLTGAKAGNYEIGTTAILSTNTASITAATLTITANAQTKIYGQNDPALTYAHAGLFGNDVITGSLTRDAGTNVGVYPITIGTISAGSNYSISYVPANLTITKATQTITWNQADIEIGCNGTVAPIQLLATSNSNLPVMYTVTNVALASVTGNILTPVANGATTITATQQGDQNHEPATAVVKNFKYQLNGAIRQRWSDVLMFDNTGNAYTHWQWYKNGNPIGGATQPYYSESAALNGTYYVLATDKNGNAVQACAVTTTGGVYTPGLKISPNPVKAGTTATVSCSYSTNDLVGAKLILSLVTGTKVQELTQVNAVNQLTMPANGGLYVLTLVLSNGQRVSVNVLVH